jgi:pyrroloquinoline-quinone synthase
MTTTAADVTRWFETVKTELLARNPFRESEYFKRFAAGTLTKAQVWGHVGNQFLLVSWFPRIFSGIHARCDDLEVRKDCARHLLVEDLGYFRGQIGGTPDHVELFKRIGDDLGQPRSVYDTLSPIPEMARLIAFLGRLAQEIPWNAALCTTAFYESQVGEMSAVVGLALLKHYGCRPDWGGMNYIVHEEVEAEESGETEGKILEHIRTTDDRRLAERAMRELHDCTEAYARGLARAYLGEDTPLTTAESVRTGDTGQPIELLPLSLPERDQRPPAK